MSGSDSDSFLSADEYASSPTLQKGTLVRKSQINKNNVDSTVDQITSNDLTGNCKTTKVESEAPKDAQVKSSSEGWNDFDDWDDNGNGDVSTATEPPRTKSVSGLSQTGLKSPAASGTVTRYDIFPVLNKLNKQIKGTPNPRKERETENKETGREVLGKNEPSWSWKPWGGVVSFLSNATEGVTTLTSQVSSGLVSAFESSIGIPDPQEMARIRKEEEKKKVENFVGDVASGGSKMDVNNYDNKEDTIRSSVGNILTGVTSIGNKVLTGGLDTLEGIGKKTMTILQENDPLLLNKRKFLGLDNDKPVLSQMLREAKEKSEETENKLKEIQKNTYKKQLHFEMLFDHYHGLVHLEALEMLSKQSSLKLQSLLEPLSGKAFADMQETLNEVKELCDLGELDDESDYLSDADQLKDKLIWASEDLGVDVDFTELIRCWSENTTNLKSMEHDEAKEVYNKALRCLAETTALIVSKMHKIAELILIKNHHSTANEADSLVQLTSVFCWHLRGIANLFGNKLNTYETTEETSALITSIFLEESSSSSYVKSAFQLFIPILQIGAA